MRKKKKQDNNAKLGLDQIKEGWMIELLIIIY
jgi:hypothetical protein